MRYPGSNWWSFDFHNHTPASSDYRPEERASVTPRDWLLAYMRAGVDCVAVTDHNCADWIDRLQNELRAMSAERPLNPEYRELHIFPGVELTASEGLHVLALYGPDESAARIHGLLTLSQYDGNQHNAEGICRQGAVAICNHIRSNGGIAVLAHAEEINGVFQGVIDAATGQFCPRWGGRVVDQVLDCCDGIEVHDLSGPALTHFAEKVDGRAVVDGSDAHRLANAGARKVWVKMAQPSIEGLKLALLDPESSLLRASLRPSAPRCHISSLNIEQLHLRRQPLEVKFSPWFNSIIGGRGSGKSTLLEALRLATARESDLDELGSDSDVRRAFSRFRQIGGARGNSGMVRQETALAGTFEKFDESSGAMERYRFTWTPATFSAMRQDETGSWEQTGLTAEQASTLFPVKVFSQKQVFELAERPSALLTYIDRAPEVGFSKWNEENDRLRRELRDLRAKERVLQQAIERKAQLETELKEVARKATAYQQSNVAEQVKVFRENQQAHQAINSFVAAVEGQIGILEGAATGPDPFVAVQLGALSLQAPDPAAVQQEAGSLIADLSRHYEMVRHAVSGMRQRIEGFRGLPTVATFLGQLDSAMGAYRQEVERLKTEGIGTAHEAEVALRRKQELEAALVLIEEKELKLAETQREVRLAYIALKFHRRILTKLRNKFVRSVLADNQNLRITIEGQADVEQSVSELRTILRLQDGTFVDDIYAVDGQTGVATGFLARLVGSDIHDPTHKRVTALKLSILEGEREILGQAIHGRLVTALSRLSSDDEDVLLEWFPHDRVTVEFRRSDSGSFQSLVRASAGQKTSAILSFLLAHGDEPLLLDQPEDDLDNALVSELVVQQIRGNKSRRQIIVVTHNPNIVVNGDAELVLPMEFVAGQIQLNDAGGLQERAVRQRICDVMEGGRDAFRQRYKRILEDLDAIS